jgi:hypothetical protein
MRKGVIMRVGFAFFVLAAGACFARPPLSRELREGGARQRRDLSLPQSRLVLNFFDFKSTNTACAYGTAANLPLHAAWLSTVKNDTSHTARSRFSRTVPELLMLYRAARPALLESVRAEEASLASSYATAWTPHALSFEGRYASGAEVRGTEFLYDERTVVRLLDFSGADDEFYLAGRFGGAADLRGDQLVVRNGQLRYAIHIQGGGAFECVTPPPGFRPLAGRGVCEAAWGGVASGVRPEEKQWWGYRISTRALKGRRLAVTVRFADEDEEAVAAPALTDAQSGEALSRREAQWDAWLAKVPEPLSVDLLASVNPKGATPEGICQAYYKAWVFTIQNVIPPDKKRYPYPQLATGKPSLWDEGECRAPFSAAWESFLGAQFYAFVEPQTAVEAFKGLMSLVDADGMLGGESLPSRKAQTAIVLYHLTGDRQMLKETYPALCRYMAWRMKFSHWIYGALKPNLYWKDAEFVFSAIIDMERLAEIARLLGEPEEAKLWQEKRFAFYKESQKWFWATPQTEPVQNWCGNGPVPNQQDHAIWVTTALYMEGLLEGDYLASTLKKFDRFYDPSANFAGFGMPKYPDLSYSVYGLLAHGYAARARDVMEACIRDIVRAGAPFAEQYVGDDFRADGVRPSLFGSSMLIDFTLLMNGYKYDRGQPAVALTSARAGGVAGISIRGVPHTLTLSDGQVLFGEMGKQKPINAKVGEVVELQVAHGE